jgi:4'-phosphopantetheinyl transferase
MDPRHIKLWLARFDEIGDPVLAREYARILSEDERQRQSRFHFARDRHRYLVTHALLRLVLSRYAAVAPADWTFTTNQYGRPEVANDLPDARRIRFNISHTNSLIAIAVTLDRAVGVDTENVVAHPAPVEIADRFFASGEVAALRALPQQQQQHRFFEHWTLKESYIKARGMGLSLPLDKFGFQLSESGRIELSVAPELADDPSRWRFWHFQPTLEYMVALCAERSDAEPPQVTISKIVPLVSEELLECSFSRVSD